MITYDEIEHKQLSFFSFLLLVEYIKVFCFTFSVI